MDEIIHCSRIIDPEDRIFREGFIHPFNFSEKIDIQRVGREFAVALQNSCRDNRRNGILLRKVVGPLKDEHILIIELKPQVKPSCIVHLIIDHGLSVTKKLDYRSPDIALFGAYPARNKKTARFILAIGHAGMQQEQSQK